MIKHDEALPDWQKLKQHSYFLDIASVNHLFEEVDVLALGFTIRH